MKNMKTAQCPLALYSIYDLTTGFDVTIRFSYQLSVKRDVVYEEIVHKFNFNLLSLLWCC